MKYARSRSRFVRALLVVMAAQVAVPSLTTGYELGHTEYGARLRLASFPARVRFDSPVPGFPDGGRNALGRAMATWSAAMGARPLFVLANEHEDALIVVRAISSGWRHGPVIGAHTDVDSDPFTGEIRRVVIEIDARRRWSDEPVVPPDALDLESILLHELGHAAGLEHSRHAEAIMRAGIKPGHVLRRTLHEDDLLGIRAALRNDSPNIKEEKPAAKTNSWMSKGLAGTLVGVVGVLFYFVGSGIHSRRRLMP